jgi:hypothetical protein
VGDRVYRCVEPSLAPTFFEHEVMPCLQDPSPA